MPDLLDRGPATPLASLYVHVPFCRDRCTYCAFATVADDPAAHEGVVQGLLDEYRAALEQIPADAKKWKTVFLGGGTPGLLARPLLDRLLSTVLPPGAHSPGELSLEVNPANVTPANLRAWAELGITRLSVGVQTFDDDVLRRLARRHDAAEADRALARIAESWPGTWSADLLVGVGGSTLAGLDRDLSHLLAHAPPHVSLYGLEVEPGTALARAVARGEQLPLGDDGFVEHERRWVARLADAGLQRYEISNFAQPGHESIHNQVYWANDAYLGLGPGACSSIGAHRWANHRDTRRWLAAVEAGRSCRRAAERIGPYARLLESLAVGLRQREGLPRAELDRRFGTAWVAILSERLDDPAAAGLLLLPDRVRLAEPERGRLDAVLKLLAARWPDDRERAA